jgi:hypothetical protein
MNTQKNTYLKTKLHMLLLAVVFIGALNWGAVAFGYNLVTELSLSINKLAKTNLPIDKVIYGLVAVCALILASRKTTWLPFLGKSILPSPLVPLKTPIKSDTKVQIKTWPNSKIAYWASKPNDTTPDTTPNVEKAYDDYSNSGVVLSNDKGEAELLILAGTDYTTPSGRKISRHVHYRVVGLKYGLMGKVKTVKY